MELSSSSNDCSTTAPWQYGNAQKSGHMQFTVYQEILFRVKIFLESTIVSTDNLSAGVQ